MPPGSTARCFRRALVGKGKKPLSHNPTLSNVTVPSSTLGPSTGRLDALDALRGMAALAVCWFHLTAGGKHLPAEWLASASSYGHLGVAVFFVLSGFVIPWSLRRTPVTAGAYASFLGKRLLRLHPPFVAACLLVVGLNAVSLHLPGYRGMLPSNYLLTLSQPLASDFFLVTGIRGQEWILVVAWTLALEVQFYVLAGLVAPRFPALQRPLGLLAVLTFGCALVWWFPASCWLFTHLPLFALGWAAVGLRLDRTAPWPWLMASMACGAVLALHDLPTALTAAGAFAAILLWQQPPARWLTGLGTISYSLYLVHRWVVGSSILACDMCRKVPDVWLWQPGPRSFVWRPHGASGAGLNSPASGPAAGGRNRRRWPRPSANTTKLESAMPVANMSI